MRQSQGRLDLRTDTSVAPNHSHAMGEPLPSSLMHTIELCTHHVNPAGVTCTAALAGSTASGNTALSRVDHENISQRHCMYLKSFLCPSSLPPAQTLAPCTSAKLPGAFPHGSHEHPLDYGSAMAPSLARAAQREAAQRLHDARQQLGALRLRKHDLRAQVLRQRLRAARVWACTCLCNLCAPLACRIRH